MPPRLRNFRAWKQQSHSFEDLAAWRDITLTLTDADDRAGLKPEQVEAGKATSNFFPLLGIHLRLGRTFTSDEMQAGKGQVAILSDELYKSRLNGDVHILGRTLIADGQPYQIVGVLPPAFELPAVWEGFDQKKPKIWVPLNLHPNETEDEFFASYVFGRLKPGVPLAQARAEMNIIGNRLAKAVPDKNTGFGINVSSLSEEDVSPDLRQALVVLLVAVLFVLLIACANVGNLLVTRAIARDKEIAVRSALGASRARIVRQAITESVLLSLLAAAAGLLLSFWGLHVLSALAPEDTHGLHELRIDATVLAFTAGIALFASLLFGLAPASHTLKANVNEVLNRSARSIAGSSNRLRNALAIAEIALSLVLLAGAGLMIRSLATLMGTDLGFQPDHLLIMRITLPDLKYTKPEQVASFNRRLIDAIRDVPGVKAASITAALPMKTVNESSFELPGKTFKPGTLPVADWARTSDGYFETLRMKLLKGRTFTRQEALSRDPDVVVINQAFARTYFPREEPLAK
jgi:putative ABC transport system permease protein